MKIVHVEERFHSAMGYQGTYIAKYKNPEDEVHFISSKSLSIWNTTNEKEIFDVQDKILEEKYGVKIWRLNPTFEIKTKYWVWLPKLKKKIKELDPDVIFLHSFETLSTIRIILSSLPKKYLVVSDTHTLLNQRWNTWRFKFYDFFLRRILAPAANRKNVILFYTAEENRLIIENIYKIKKENVFSLLIGTSFSDFYFDNESRVRLRNEFGISSNGKVLLYTGKFNDRKKPHLILSALALIENQIKDHLYVIFIGAKDKTYYDKFFKYDFKNHKVKIIILDAIPSNELYKYYSMGDFAVFPAENTLSSLDSQACKLPVIMEDDFTNCERLKKGGLVFQKNNMADLGEKILKLLNDPALLKTLREDGYNYMKERYDYKKIIADYESFLYDRLKYFHKQK